MNERERHEGKLREVADLHNGLLAREQALVEELTAVKEERIQAFGRAQALNELFQEILAEESKETLKDSAANGNGKPRATSRNPRTRR